MMPKEKGNRSPKTRFLNNWDPESSNRETRKLSRSSTYRDCSRTVHDNRGRLVKHSLRDVCDCLEEVCPGCHFPCPQCSSTKCGHECRNNRRWLYESVEIECGDFNIKNKYK